MTVRLFGDLLSRLRLIGGSGLVENLRLSSSDTVSSVSKIQTQLMVRR